MANANNRPLAEYPLVAKTASIGATPAVAYAVVPFRGKIVRTYVVSEGAATGAIAVAVAINGGSNIGALSIAAAGAGVSASDVPGVNGVSKDVKEGDVISFTPSGGAGATIPGHFVAVIKRR